jgi:hypothetical protein
MTRDTLHTVYLYGALRVIVADATGAVVAVQCRTDGAAAEGRYRAAYIASATAYALRAHASIQTEG